MKSLLLILLVWLKICVIYCDSNCDNLKTCGECIQRYQDRCVWCSAENYNGNRCQSKNDHKNNNNWCSVDLSTPRGEGVVVINDNYNTGENGKKVVQFRPQKVKIRATPGVPINVTMAYKPAKDAPLDVYYLLDNSYTMDTYKELLKTQADSIYSQLRQLTNNVRLGIGTFVDKPVLPFANIHFENNVYTFRNHLSLTDNVTEFQFTLNNRSRGSNYDDPEAVLEGLMQAMVCVDEIGWRKDARRIIVVFTDGQYHSYGDGKVVGAYKPHDMKCHKFGSKDMILEYPSVGLINKVSQGFSIIFAVTDNVKKDYDLLSQSIDSAKYLSIHNNVDIAKMITTEYLKIVNKIDIQHKAPPYIDVIITPNCTDCKATHYNPVNLIATFTIKTHPKPAKLSDVLLWPTSLNEQLVVEVEVITECECEKETNSEHKSAKCNRAGSYQCGICKCDVNRYGNDCRCEGDAMESEDFDKCKSNPNETVHCSGHGTCRCGKCEECSEDYSGKFCEFNNNACPKPKGLRCSGHGVCDFGKCTCAPGWTGADCGCSLDTSTCRAPYSHVECSENGECVCGQCRCTIAENPADTCRGRFCDECKASAKKRCDELKDYAYCIYQNNTNCRDEYNQTDTRAIFMNKTEMNSPNTDWYMANWCRIDKDDSIFVFKYYYSPAKKDVNETLVLVIQKELEIPPPVNIWIPIGSALGVIILIGLLTLILWKVITDLYDEREYKQFMEKARAAGYCATENPWYEPPVVNFINPAHRIN